MARTRPAVRMGVLNLLVMVIALSLAVLAVLSLATARAGQALAEREQQSVQEVYSCEAAGQRFLAALDDELAPARKAGGGAARIGEALQTGLADLQQQAVAGAEGLSAQVELLEGQDASALEGALRGAQRELVKPEIENLLMILGETGQAHIARPGLEDLVFEIHIAMYDEICETLSRCVREGTGAAQPFREAVEAARFLWERVLDMDYGSMEIVKLDEMLPVAERLVQRLRTL